MRRGIFRLAILLLTATLSLSLAAAAQTKKKVEITAEDIQALREAIAAQQQQIQALQQELRQRDEATRRAMDQLREAQNSAQAATARAASAETAATQTNTTVDEIKAELEAVKQTQAATAAGAQEETKRVFGLEQTMGRFRWSGDIRVRGEGFYQNRAGCGQPCTDRWRARFRARLGIDGRINDDFIGGIAVASGSTANGNPTFTDPISTNETLSSFFEKKALGIDRAYVSWTPQNMKWITATGGKWAFNWQKSPVTFDNDVNPEGFTMTVTKNFTHQYLKQVAVQPILLMYNEVGGGPDSNAVGGQIRARFQLGTRVTFTPSYMVLNWNGSDAIAQAAFPVTLPQPNTPATGTPLPQPTVQPARIINGNAMTNATAIVGTGTAQRRVFVSDFMYSDLHMGMNIRTPWARFPINLTGEYLKNLRARNAEDTMYYVEFAMGQTRAKNDVQFGYSYAHVEQDSILSQFGESDYRAASNVAQNRFFFNWALSPSVTANYTLFVGRTLDTSLQNAVRLSGVAAGAEEPWLKRMQIDLVYKF